VRGSSQQRKHAELDKQLDITMKRELAIYEKKIELAEEEILQEKKRAWPIII
jgi:hypothetical protein